MAHPVRNLGITIHRPFAEAYAFAHRPENFAKWAAGLATALRQSPHGWVADTPEGEAIVTFSPANDYGVIDHRVVLPGKPEIHIPLRLVPNGDSATEVVFTLFRQPGLDDAEWNRDVDAVSQDLITLKAILEGGPEAPIASSRIGGEH